MTTIPIELDQETLAAVDSLSIRLGRSREVLIRNALTSYITEGEAFLALLQEADDAIDRGEFFTQEQMEEWARSRRHAAAAE